MNEFIFLVYWIMALIFVAAHLCGVFEWVKSKLNVIETVPSQNDDFKKLQSDVDKIKLSMGIKELKSKGKL